MTFERVGLGNTGIQSVPRKVIVLHGGDIRSLADAAGCQPDEVLDVSASINPSGPPLWLRDVVARALGDVVHYPDPECRRLRSAASQHFHIDEARILACPGTESVIQRLPKALAARRVVLPCPCYSGYHLSAKRAELPVVSVMPVMPDDSLRYDLDALNAALEPEDLVFIGHPANPTGNLLDDQSLAGLMKDHPRVTFVIDEAFIELCDDAQSFLGRSDDNLVVLRSLTKAFAIPGMRVGLAFASPRIIKLLQQTLDTWAVGTLEEAVATACLQDDTYLSDSRQNLRSWRNELADDLNTLPGCRVFPGSANYHLLQLPINKNAEDIAASCLTNGVALRTGSDLLGLGTQWLRIAVRTPKENRRCLGALSDALGGAPAVVIPKPKPALMLQGCSSDAGKSLMAAAFCRVLWQDGYDVAPYKAQNMANNAGVTHDGREIGRAQILQAQASHIDPDVRMNPVLLKPTSEKGAQVVLMGEVHDHMDVRTYHKFKQQAEAVAHRAYDSLAADHEVIVLEGAGSPGEVNLRGKDFVNMPMAAYANAAVCLVGDIDRGGVYASLAGHCETFTSDERRRICGFLINKFRGDASLLDPAHDWLLARTGIPVLGTIPHLGRHGLPEEDSLGLASGWTQRKEAELHIAVVGIPHLANASDLDPLASEPDIDLFLAKEPQQLQGADAIILPGSKASLADADWISDSGMASAIKERHAAGTTVIGICGGLQIMGTDIADPQRIESDGVTRRGLGLQPWQTTMAAHKTRRSGTAKHHDGTELRGYEIHHGETDWSGSSIMMTADDGRAIGAGHPDCWGSYLHGLFDSDPFRHQFLDGMRQKKGLAPLKQPRPRHDLEPAIDLLAETIRQQVDLGTIYKAMGLT